MGSHVIQVPNDKATRIHGYKMHQRMKHLEVVPSRWNKSWPKLANRFQTIGVLKGLEISTKGTVMIVALELDAVAALIAGRRRKSNLRKVIGFSMLTPVLVIASFIPLKNGGVEQIPLKVATRPSEPCSLEALGRWLQGAGESEDIKIQGTSILGGVTVGTLDCKGSRYSYTLGSEEPKRVLKLQKLDS